MAFIMNRHHADIHITQQHVRGGEHCRARCNPQDAALARNVQRDGSERMPEEVIRRMATRLEEPDRHRYAWEQNTITLPPESLPPLDDPQVAKSRQSDTKSFRSLPLLL